jgi:hypothetical protein
MNAVVTPIVDCHGLLAKCLSVAQDFAVGSD